LTPFGGYHLDEAFGIGGELLTTLAFRRLARFPPWTGEALTVDAVRPLAQNLATVLEYLTD
jgi:hypothetical protein